MFAPGLQPLVVMTSLASSGLGSGSGTGAGAGAGVAGVGAASGARPGANAAKVGRKKVERRRVLNDMDGKCILVWYVVFLTLVG